MAGSASDEWPVEKLEHANDHAGTLRPKSASRLDSRITKIPITVPTSTGPALAGGTGKVAAFSSGAIFVERLHFDGKAAPASRLSGASSSNVREPLIANSQARLDRMLLTMTTAVVEALLPWCVAQRRDCRTRSAKTANGHIASTSRDGDVRLLHRIDHGVLRRQRAAPTALAPRTSVGVLDNSECGRRDDIDSRNDASPTFGEIPQKRRVSHRKTLPGDKSTCCGCRNTLAATRGAPSIPRGVYYSNPIDEGLRCRRWSWRLRE